MQQKKWFLDRFFRIFPEFWGRFGSLITFGKEGKLQENKQKEEKQKEKEQCRKGNTAVES